MKKPTNVIDLASELTAANHAPLVPLPVTEPPSKRQKAASIPLLLRLPADLHRELEDEAIRRTREKGRGVSVQQIILEKLEAVK